MSIMKIKTAQETANADYGIAQMLEQPGGFEKFAAESLPTFIRETRDYEAFGRQVLVAHNVTGEDCQMINNEPYVYYAKDMNSHAAWYNDDGMVPRLAIEGEGVNVGISALTSDDTTIYLKRLMVQRYNYLERTRELSGQAVAKLEDNKILDLVNAVIQADGTIMAPQHMEQIVKTTDASLSKPHLVALRQCITRHNIPLGNFVMNQMRQDDILRWAQADVDQLTQREILETGAKYSIWGMKIITSPIVSYDEVYLFAEPEYVGRMPILKDLTLKLTDTPNKLVKGLFMYEFIGFYIASHKAVAKLVLNYVAEELSYTAVPSGASAPTWTAGTYYKKTGDVYAVTTEEPSDWSSGYTSYYTATVTNPETATHLIKYSSTDVEGAMAKPTNRPEGYGALEGNKATRAWGPNQDLVTQK